MAVAEPAPVPGPRLVKAFSAAVGCCRFFEFMRHEGLLVWITGLLSMGQGGLSISGLFMGEMSH